MLFNIMIYTLKQFNTSKVHNKLILVTLLIVSTPFLILSKLAQNNFIITQDTNLTELMLVSMALPYQYYLPITAAFFYILNDIFWGLDEKHIYFFNSRKRWIINKVISSIFISFTYVTLVYIFISLIFYFKLKLAINTDFIIYNIPQLAGTALTQSLLTEMLKNPRVKGVKNSSMPVQDIQIFKAMGGEDFTVFNGPDEQLISGRIMGADGGIGGTYGAMPELILKENELINEMKLEEARKIQYNVNSIIYKLCSGHGNMYAMIKEVLRINSSLDIGGVREPLTNLAPSDIPIAQEAAAMIKSAVEKYCH